MSPDESHAAMIASFAEIDVTSATAVTNEIFGLAGAATSDGAGSRVAALLQRAGALSATSDTHSLQREADALAGEVEARVASLLALKERIGPIGQALDAAITRLTTIRAGKTADTSPHVDQFERQTALTLIDRRVGALQAIAGTLERARLLTEQWLHAERLAGDELSLMRDVTAPVAIGAAKFRGLADAGAGAVVMAGDIDREVAAMLRSDTARAGARR